MKKLLFGYLFLLLLIHKALALDVNVSTYGAMGNGITDDRAAIQNAINAVNAAGGGTVNFGAGTFRVGKVPDASHIQVICLQIYSNIILKGAGRNNTIIKLIDNIGDFEAVISPKPSWQRVDNFELRDIAVDENSANNSTPTEVSLKSSGFRDVLRIYIGKNIKVENCLFTNTKGVWVLVFHGIIDNVLVNNNIMNNIGDAVNDWDHSTIFTNGNNITLTNNQISALNVNGGTFGARTGIEIHGSNQYIAFNTISGMTAGVNVTGYTPENLGSQNQTYYKNTIKGGLQGFLFWSESNPTKPIGNTTGLNNILLIDNEIELNPSAWVNYQFYSGSQGFYFEQNRNTDIKNIYTIRNKVKFVGSSNVPQTRAIVGLDLSKNNKIAEISDFYFLNNRIENSFGPAINLSDWLDKSIIGRNTILNAGTSTATPTFDAFRAGVFLDETLNNVQFSHNTFTDNQTTPTLKRVFSNYSNNIGNSLNYNNTTNVTTAIPFFNDASASGAPWINTLTKPLVFFNKDSIAFAKGSTSTELLLQLSSAQSTAVTVNIYKQDYNTTLPTSFAIAQNQIIFNLGETSKSVSITASNSTGLMNNTNAQLVINYTVGAFPGAMQHCKLEMIDAVLPISLATFTAKKQLNTTLITWQTSSETNNNFFELERSYNGNDFIVINTQKSKGKTNKSYFFNDDDKTEKIVYYRLKQVDMDGKFTFSKTISLNNDIANTLSAYPNPFTYTTNISASKNIATLKIISASGQIIFNKKLNQKNYLLAGADIVNGLYILEVVYEDGSKKVVKLLKE